MIPCERNRKSKRAKKPHQDLISALPIEMLQHILSSMPTLHAVRSSILSTTWLHAWNSLPVFTFNFSCQTQQLEDTFPLLTKFNRTISILNEKDEPMHVTFRVSWPSFQKASHANCIDQWMRLVSKHCVREIEIDVLPEEQEEEEEGYDDEEEEEEEDEDRISIMETYNLPHETLFSVAESLVVLKLRGCRIPLQSLSLQNTNLVSLRVLFWKDNFNLVEHDATKELLPLCPVLEEFTLISVCKRVPSIFLSDHRKLKHVKLDGFLDVTLGDLPNLQVLDLSNFAYLDCENYSNGCSGLKKLSLRSCWYTNYSSVQFFIYNLPSLQSLDLKFDGIWPVSISNVNMENLSLSSSVEPPKIEIHAPRLCFYEYRSSVLPPTSFETEPCAFKRIDLVLSLDRDETVLFFKSLRSNLVNLAAYNRTLKLTINAKKFLPDEQPPEEGHSPAFVDSVELQDIPSSLTYNRTLIKWLLWCCRPLQLSTRHSNIFFKVFRDIIYNAKLRRYCCNCTCSCLRAVKVETPDGIKDFKDIKNDEYCELLSKDVLRFRLEWL